MTQINIKDDYIFFWLDHLEFTIKDYQESPSLYDYNTQEWPCFNIDWDNSDWWHMSFAWIHWTYHRFSPPWYSDWLRFSASFEWRSVSLFAILKWKENRGIWQRSKDKVVFYSTFFVLEKSDKLDFSIKEFYEAFFTDDKTDLHRLDIAIDLPYDIKKIKSQLLKDVNFFSEIWNDKKHPEFSQTYYINNPQSNSNRKFLFRVYDKILDTWKKQKWFLYPHLIHNHDVRRIELELRPEECKRITDFSISDILENRNKPIQRIFTKYFNRYTEHELHYKDIELKKYTNVKFDLKSYYLQHWHIPKDYLSRSHWYLKTIQNNTWYVWLFDTVLWVQKESKETIRDRTSLYQYEYAKSKWYNVKQFKLVNRKLFNWYDLLENLIIYLQEQWLEASIINRILKKYTIKPKIKLWKKSYEKKWNVISA